MMCECCKCKGEILTEADPYVYQSTPSGVKLTCYSCYKITPDQKIIQFEQQLAQQQALLDEAVRVVEFYANTVNYEYAGDKFFGGYARPVIKVEMEDVCHVASDEWCLYGGKRARAFLAKKEINQILGKEKGIMENRFTAFVVLDNNNKAICYLDESLGTELEVTKNRYKRKNYKIVELTGDLEGEKDEFIDETVAFAFADSIMRS